ncbi:hypothetical protein NEUTE2DRAFT_166886 [Neurospora tetrasperma FGSC 2509]|nr:hypothetical protein NEUTE2DRAFT_166886 [Neurospora tetrasperma FGSC 2509]
MSLTSGSPASLTVDFVDLTSSVKPDNSRSMRREDSSTDPQPSSLFPNPRSPSMVGLCSSI